MFSRTARRSIRRAARCAIMIRGGGSGPPGGRMPGGPVIFTMEHVFSLWREHHIRMAQRMIGSKPGTGQHIVESTYGKGSPMGSIGVDYLVQTLTKKFFPVLWAARTEM